MWFSRLLSTTPDLPAPGSGPVFALLRAHATPHGTEEVVLDWLACPADQARRVATTLNAHEGRRRYRAVPLRALGAGDLEEVTLHRTTLTLKGRQAGGVRYTLTQHRRSFPRAFAPTLDRRRSVGGVGVRLESWSACPAAGLHFAQMLAPVQQGGVPEVLQRFVGAWGAGALSGRTGRWPRATGLPGGGVLWAHADGGVYVWPGRGRSVSVQDLRVDEEAVFAPDRWRVSLSVLGRVESVTPD